MRADDLCIDLAELRRMLAREPDPAHRKAIKRAIYRLTEQLVAAA